MIQLAAFAVLGIALIAELCWLHLLDRRARRLADRYVETHAGDADASDIVRANQLAWLGAIVCMVAVVALAARLPFTQGWLTEADLFFVVVLVPTSTFLLRVATRLKEVGSHRGLR